MSHFLDEFVLTITFFSQELQENNFLIIHQEDEKINALFDGLSHLTPGLRLSDLAVLKTVNRLD